MQAYDIAIIGGGVLGTCISYWLSLLYDAKICVIEKEQGVAMHASSRNTAVIHSPFYLDPSTKKVLARSAMSSYAMWERLAEKTCTPWRKTGVLEIALDEYQHKSLEEYMQWGNENGIPQKDIHLLDEREVAQIEPNIECHSAILCKREVSSNFGILTDMVKRESQSHGTRFLFDMEVERIQQDGQGLYNIISAGKDHVQEISANLVINCAGGNALDIAQMFGLATDHSDLHFRGEYWVAEPPHDKLVNTTVYTVAEFKGYPFLDPHWIKKADGTTEVGPNAVPVPGPETYDGYIGDLDTAVSKFVDIVTGSAKRLLVDAEFLSLVSKEWFSSVSKTAMIGRVRKFIPRARPEFFQKRGTAGIRTPIITPEGKFLPDVMELEDDHSFHILNYNSPGATGAPAYAALVVKRLCAGGFLHHARDSPPNSVWRLADIDG